MSCLENTGRPNRKKPTLETACRKITQPPRGGFVPLKTLKIEKYGKPMISVDSSFSHMLLSAVVRNIATYAALGEASDEALLPPLTKAKAKVEVLEDQGDRMREISRITKIVDRINAAPISADGIRAWCELLSYDIVDKGGRFIFPDGGRMDPDAKDRKVIKELAHRAAMFLCMDNDDDTEFEFEKEVAADFSNFDKTTINFLIGKRAIKVSTLSSPPPPRDVLLVVAQAMLANKTGFGIYNPNWDAFYWGEIKDIPKDRRDQIIEAVFDGRKPSALSA